MFIENAKLKTVVKRLSCIYKKNHIMASSGYITLLLSKVEEEYYFEIKNSNNEGIIKETIRLQNTDIDKNADVFLFPFNVPISVYGEIFFNIINKNSSSGFTLSISEKEKKLIIIADGKYVISYVDETELLWDIKKEFFLYSFSVEAGRLVKMIDTVNRYQSSSNEGNLQLHGIEMQIKNVNDLWLRAYDSVSIAEVTASVEIEQEDLSFPKIKFTSKFVLPYLKTIDKEDQILVSVYTNAVYIEMIPANTNIPETSLGVPVLVGSIPNIKAVKDNIVASAIGAFKVIPARFEEAINKTLFNIIDSYRIFMVFTDEKLIEISITVADYFTNINVPLISSEDLNGKQFIMSADLLLRVLKGLTLSSEFVLVKSGLYVTDSEEGMMKEFIILSMRDK